MVWALTRAKMAVPTSEACLIAPVFDSACISQSKYSTQLTLDAAELPNIYSIVLCPFLIHDGTDG